MKRKTISILAAAALALATVAPGAAQAEEGGYHERHHGDHYDRRDGYRDHRGDDRRRRHYYRDRDDDDEALAAGVIGLVLGLAIGAAASQPDEPEPRCYDNYRRCDPPPYRQGYYDQGGDDEAYYDPRYEEPAPQCTRRERQWDRYANRYVTVDVPC